MGSVAFVFSGQGAQYPGMGRALYEENAAARAVFDRLFALRPETKRQCFEGSPEELAETINTQPCLYAVELAFAAAARDAGLSCASSAGFSLGELAALADAGAYSAETGFRLCCRRAALMQQAAEQNPGGMAAVVKLSPEQVEALCVPYAHVFPVNYNCPGQVSVSGRPEELAAFSQDVRLAGGRAIPLKVRGGFHSPFMRQAAEAFLGELRQVEFQETAFPVYADCTAEPYGGDCAALLSQQIDHPVRWQTITERMAAAGVDTFLELGPGKTLCGLIAKTIPAARVFHAEDSASLSEALEGISKC